MLFQPNHITAIRAGEKTATRRDWSGKQVVEGGVYIASPEMFTSEDEADCYIRVTRYAEEPLQEMTEADAEKEGGYTLSEFKEKWEDINGDGSWNPDKVVSVVEFEYVGRSRPDE